MQFRIVGGQDVWRNIVDGDSNVLGDARVKLAELVLAQVVQLGCEFDASRPTTDDRNVQEFLRALGAGARQARLLEQVEQRLANAHRVADVFDEDRMLVNPWRAECVGHAARCDDKVVVADVELDFLKLWVFLKGWRALA